MALRYLPDLLDPWTDATLDKLTVDEAIWVHMRMGRYMKMLEDRVERDYYFLRHNKEKYKKIFEFDKSK